MSCAAPSRTARLAPPHPRRSLASRRVQLRRGEVDSVTAALGDRVAPLKAGWSWGRESAEQAGGPTPSTVSASCGTNAVRKYDLELCRAPPIRVSSIAVSPRLLLAWLSLLQPLSACDRNISPPKFAQLFWRTCTRCSPVPWSRGRPPGGLFPSRRTCGASGLRPRRYSSYFVVRDGA